MNFTNEPVLTETDAGQVDAVLYQVMLDETIRLRKCMSRGERRNIRKFLTKAYQLYAEKNLGNAIPNTFPENMKQQQ